LTLNATAHFEKRQETIYFGFLSQKNLILFYNPRSGRFSMPELERIFQAFGSYFPNIRKIHDAAQLREVNNSHVISVGGDGTLHVLINHLDLESNSVTVWKMGSGNDFVSNWKQRPIPELCEAIAQNKIEPIDLIRAGDTALVHTVWGVGFDAYVTQKAHDWNLRIPFLKYILPIARYLFFYKPIQVRVESENYSYQGPAFMLSIGNGPRAGGGFRLFPTAQMKDGKINVLLIKPPGFFQKLAYVWLVSFGKHNTLKMVETAEISACTITLDSASIMGCDGDVYPCKTIEISVLTGALQLIQ
jgi:diacylglycerol kinase (ATP)